MLLWERCLVFFCCEMLYECLLSITCLFSKLRFLSGLRKTKSVAIFEVFDLFFNIFNIQSVFFLLISSCAQSKLSLLWNCACIIMNFSRLDEAYFYICNVVLNVLWMLKHSVHIVCLIFLHLMIEKIAREFGGLSNKLQGWSRLNLTFDSSWNNQQFQTKSKVQLSQKQSLHSVCVYNCICSIINWLLSQVSSFSYMQSISFFNNN